MDWQNKHSKNGHILKSLPYVQSVPIQSSMTLFKEPQNNPDIDIEQPKTPHNQNNPEKKDNGHRITIPGFILYHKDAVTKKPHNTGTINRHRDKG